jgi:hypothetical protein
MRSYTTRDQALLDGLLASKKTDTFHLLTL